MNFFISPKKIKSLSSETIILVDRDVLNARVAFLISSGSNDCTDSLLRLLSTLGDTLSTEYKVKSIVSYVPFMVKDVLKLFPDYESFPDSAFVSSDTPNRTIPEKP